jgi:HEAT repeat protein
MTTDDPLPDLLRALQSRSAEDRVKAAKDLGRLGWLAREALPELVAHLNDPEPRVREAVAQAIGQMGPDALPTLAEMLTHPDKYVRRQAVWALGRLGPLARPLLPNLCESLKDPDPRTATGAAQTLGHMGADAADAVPALAEAMRGTNIVLCRLAAKALSQIGPPALPTLIAHLQHSDPFVRGEAAMALGWMGPVARSAVPFLASLVRSPRSSLARTPPPRRAAGSTDPSTDPHDWPTPPQNPADAPAGDSPEENCRVYAAQALGRIGAPARPALDDLREAARFGPDPLRRTAQFSIRQIEGS